MRPNCNLTNSAAGRGAAFEETQSPTRRARPLNHFLTDHARLGAALGLLAALAFGPPPAQAAVTEAWVQRYNGPGTIRDNPSAVVVDNSGQVVVTGNSGTLKYAAADGALLWGPRYIGGDGRAVAVDGSGNVVVTGYSYGTNGNADFYTAKYAAADGALLWEQRYNGPEDSNDRAFAVVLDGNGNVVVTGMTDTSWDYDFGDYYTAKYAAADGALLWEQRYGSANGFDYAHALAVDGSGNVVVTGYSYGINGNADFYTVKYAAANGALLWEQRYNGPGNNNDYANAVAVDGTGNVVVTGYSYNSSGNPKYYTAKYAAADGTLLWEKRYNGPGGTSIPLALAVDGSGNVVVTGFSDGGASMNDYYTARYAAADGALLWEKRYNGPANSYDSAQAVAVDGGGNVVVTGFSDNGTNDYYTAKYAAADGALIWEKRYNGPANGHAFVSSLALGPNGMVAVTVGDYATVVYWENLPPVSIALVPTGIRLRFTGVPGRSYTIERAPAVTGPWSTLATPTTPLDGLIEHLDTTAPVGSAFYRTFQP